MEQSKKVQIPKNVLDGLEAVRVSGKTNMFDVNKVIELALEMDFVDTAFWIYENRRLYATGIIQGFESNEGGD
ncbi:MAG: DUF5049 domain-containing protein [Armatimonadota bacterium]